MNKKLLYVLVLSGFLLVTAFFTSAQLTKDDIVFPIPELGNCEDEDACRAYCDVLENHKQCFDFAKKYGLIEEGVHAEKAPPVGPGGCTSEKECRSYCEDVSRADECISFALENGYMTEEEANKIRKELQRTGPGNCKGHEGCKTFCDDPGNRDTCLEYAHKEGLVSDTDYKTAKKVTTQGGPGGCKSHVECREYCSIPANLDGCLTFAEKEGHISSDEVKRIRKIGVTTGPGGCKFEECKVYCDDPSHQQECIAFAEEKGLMTPEQAAQAKKFAGKTGPGGCKGHNECRNYCGDQNNAEKCLEFAVQEGLMPPQEIERARKFIKASAEGGPGGCKGVGCRDYCEDSSHRDECFNFAKNQGLLGQEELKQFEVGLKINKVMEEQGGPGGCKTEPECMQYCSDSSHVEECVSFGAAHGGIPEAEVRQMLKQFSEGRFEAHGDFGPRGDFGEFEEESFRRFQEFKQLEDQFRGGGGFPGGPGGFGGEFPGGPGEFPGGPGGFPGGGMPGGFPGGPGGGGGFQGPGGCSSPAECIKHCTQNPQDCFGGSGGPDGSGGPGGFPGHGPRQLRPDLLRQIQSPSGGAEREEFAPEETSSSGVSWSIRMESVSANRFKFIFRSSGGVGEFLLLPAQGDHYGGSVPACDHEFIAETTFSGSAFPMRASLVDCQSNEKYEKELQSPFERPVPPSGQEAPAAIPEGISFPPGGIPDGFSFPPGGFPEGFQIPPGGLPEGFGFPEGFQIPPGGIPEGFQVPEGLIPSGTAPEAPHDSFDTREPAQIECDTKGGIWIDDKVLGSYCHLSDSPSVSNETGGISNSKVYLRPLHQYGPDKYSIVVEDPEGVKEFGVQGTGGEGLYSGGYNTARLCNDAENLSRPSGTVTIPATYFPLSARVTDCNGVQGFFSVTPPVEAGQAPASRGFFAGLFESVKGLFFK